MDSLISLKQKPRSYWFLALVSYYVLAMYLVPSSAIVAQFSLTYFALIIPAWLYVIANWRYLVMGYSNASKGLAMFAILASVIGVVRWDISLAYNAIFLATVAIVTLNSRAYVTISELNRLFLCAVIGSVVVYALGITDYGFLPGQAYSPSCHEAMNWRISLFRVPAESAIFSFVILIVNILYGNRVSTWLRVTVILLATYYLVFSGVRSIVFPALVVCFISALNVLSGLCVNRVRRIYAVAALVSIVALSISLFLWGNVEAFENYWLRTKTCSYIAKYEQQVKYEQQAGYTKSSETVKNWTSQTFNRHCPAMYQLSIFAKSPLGLQNVQPESDSQLTAVGCPPGQLDYYCASCNFATHWLARAGISAIPLLMSFVILMVGGYMRRSAGTCSMLVVFGFVSLAWGVMLVPYSFVFILMWAVPAIAAVHEQTH